MITAQDLDMEYPRDVDVTFINKVHFKLTTQTIIEPDIVPIEPDDAAIFNFYVPPENIPAITYLGRSETPSSDYKEPVCEGYRFLGAYKSLHIFTK